MLVSSVWVLHYSLRTLAYILIQQVGEVKLIAGEALKERNQASADNSADIGMDRRNTSGQRTH